VTKYIIHGPFVDDLQLDVGCDFIYAINAILIVNVGCNYSIIGN
jgi:hypothetical protein